MGVQLGDLRPFLDSIIGKLNRIDKHLNSSACCTATTIGSSGDTSVPAGLSSVSIVQTSSMGNVIITLSQGNFVLNGEGQVFTDVAGDGQKLPAYTISGSGTWQWHGIK